MSQLHNGRDGMSVADPGAGNHEGKFPLVPLDL